MLLRHVDDKDVDTLIEHFRDPDRRKEFFKEYKEIEILASLAATAKQRGRSFVSDLTGALSEGQPSG
jgi:hypothetical protein